MRKKLAFLTVVFCVFAFSGVAVAAPPFGAPWMISYDGFLQGTYSGSAMTNVTADTLIVVTNSHPSRNAGVWIEVFDLNGNQMGVGKTLYDYNGGNPLTGNILPGDNSAWITLSDVVNRATVDPWGFASGEKFSYRIYFAPGEFPPIVEVKQVVYNLPAEFPLEAIWQTGNYASWAETSLGGLNGTGIVKAP